MGLTFYGSQAFQKDGDFQRRPECPRPEMAAGDWAGSGPSEEDQFETTGTSLQLRAES